MTDLEVENLLTKLLVAHFISYDDNHDLPRVALQGWAEITPEEFEYIKVIRPEPDDLPHFVEEDDD